MNLSWGENGVDSTVIYYYYFELGYCMFFHGEFIHERASMQGLQPHGVLGHLDPHETLLYL